MSFSTLTRLQLRDLRDTLTDLSDDTDVSSEKLEAVDLCLAEVQTELDARNAAPLANVRHYLFQSVRTAKAQSQATDSSVDDATINELVREVCGLLYDDAGLRFNVVAGTVQE